MAWRSGGEAVLVLLHVFVVLQSVSAFPLRARHFHGSLARPHSVHPPHLLPTVSTATSSTRLFGLRLRARQRIASLFGRLRRKKQQRPEPIINGAARNPINETIIIATHYEETSSRPSSTNGETLGTSLSSVTPPRRVEDDDYTKFIQESLPPNNGSFLYIPPINTTDRLRHSSEFHSKIEHFQQYTPRDIALLKSVRLRIVMDGMRASPLEPAVYRAFEVLYQDLLPLRVAGRFIFRRLSYVLKMCQETRQNDLELLQNSSTTGMMSQELLEAAQYAFLLLVEDTTPNSTEDDSGINNDSEHDVLLPMVQLNQSGVLSEVIAPRLGMENNQEQQQLLEWMMSSNSNDNSNINDTLNFPQFVQGLQQCIRESSGHDHSKKNSSLLLQSLLQDFCVQVARRTNGRRTHRVLDEQRQQYSDRFESMLDAFAGWKALVPPPERKGRMLDVLRGCFVGAQNEAVREALRVVYVDHPTMRVAGNTIFALMSALIPTSPSSSSSRTAQQQETQDQLNEDRQNI
ncbi:expressed unknown protein [Seminavis robusta]|uniref:Uncharacterized protein n=1 Tax=Seminavis robusta TaxID=568900 RepID=A0A9N8HMA1_9STRA|nr:expressed unknown protein [Seminavis robusta]|eukprot:Sro890_g216690.1 n/a (517) ;mRNA; r:6849-8399